MGWRLTPAVMVLEGFVRVSCWNIYCVCAVGHACTSAGVVAISWHPNLLLHDVKSALPSFAPYTLMVAFYNFECRLAKRSGSFLFDLPWVAIECAFIQFFLLVSAGFLGWTIVRPWSLVRGLQDMIYQHTVTSEGFCMGWLAGHSFNGPGSWVCPSKLLEHLP